MQDDGSCAAVTYKQRQTQLYRARKVVLRKVRLVMVWSGLQLRDAAIPILAIQYNDLHQTCEVFMI